MILVVVNFDNFRFGNGFMGFAGKELHVIHSLFEFRALLPEAFAYCIIGKHSAVVAAFEEPVNRHPRLKKAKEDIAARNTSASDVITHLRCINANDLAKITLRAVAALGKVFDAWSDVVYGIALHRINKKSAGKIIVKANFLCILLMIIVIVRINNQE